MVIIIGKSRGFALIELIVCIIIVAVLMGVTLPLYSTFRSGAREVKCVAHLKQCGVALTAYAGENQGWLPPIRRDYSPKLENRYATLFWTSLIASYLQKSYVDQAGQTFLRCPERATLNLSAEPENNYTYGLTYGKASGFDTVVEGQVVRAAVYSNNRIAALRDLAVTYILADAHASQYPQTDWPHPSGWFGITGELNKVAFVHGGRGGMARANFLLGDGSIRSLTVEEWRNNQGGIWGEPW